MRSGFLLTSGRANIPSDSAPGILSGPDDTGRELFIVLLVAAIRHNYISHMAECQVGIQELSDVSLYFRQDYAGGAAQGDRGVRGERRRIGIDWEARPRASARGGEWVDFLTILSPLYKLKVIIILISSS